MATAFTIFSVSCKNNSVEALSNGSICDTSAVKYSTRKLQVKIHEN